MSVALPRIETHQPRPFHVFIGAVTMIASRVNHTLMHAIRKSRFIINCFFFFVLTNFDAALCRRKGTRRRKNDNRPVFFSVRFLFLVKSLFFGAQAPPGREFSAERAGDPGVFRERTRDGLSSPTSIHYPCIYTFIYV